MEPDKTTMRYASLKAWGDTKYAKYSGSVSTEYDKAVMPKNTYWKIQKREEANCKELVEAENAIIMEDIIIEIMDIKELAESEWVKPRPPVDEARKINAKNRNAVKVPKNIPSLRVGVTESVDLLGLIANFLFHWEPPIYFK